MAREDFSFNFVNSKSSVKTMIKHILYYIGILVTKIPADIFPSVEETCRFNFNGIDRVQWSDDGHKSFIQRIPWAMGYKYSCFVFVH